MLNVRRIYTFRNRRNQIYGYKLEDEHGNTMNVTPKDLKCAIKNGEVRVINMTLTSNNRLVDSDSQQE